MFEHECYAYLSGHKYDSFGVFGDNTNGDRTPGCLKAYDDFLRKKGFEFRRNICNCFQDETLARPSINWHKDHFNHTKQNNW